MQRQSPFRNWVVVHLSNMKKYFLILRKWCWICKVKAFGLLSYLYTVLASVLDLLKRCCCIMRKILLCSWEPVKKNKTLTIPEIMTMNLHVVFPVCSQSFLFHTITPGFFSPGNFKALAILTAILWPTAILQPSPTSELSYGSKLVSFIVKIIETLRLEQPEPAQRLLANSLLSCVRLSWLQ